MGLSTALSAPVSIAAPIYFGWAFDSTGDYMGAFTLVAMTVAASAIVAAFIVPPKLPAEVRDIKS